MARFHAAASRASCPALTRGGFTLVEMMVTLAIAAVLLGVAVPSFSAIVRDTRLTTATSSLHAALFLTRSEAIKRNRRATLCTSQDQTTCEAGIGWHRGWIVFEDGNGNGVREPGEALVSVAAAQPNGVTITGNTPVRNYVSYVPTGTTRTVGGALQMGTITVCGDSVARQIVISASGRPRVVRNASC